MCSEIIHISANFIFSDPVFPRILCWVRSPIHMMKDYFKFETTSFDQYLKSQGKQMLSPTTESLITFAFRSCWEIVFGLRKSNMVCSMNEYNKELRFDVSFRRFCHSGYNCFYAPCAGCFLSCLKMYKMVGKMIYGAIGHYTGPDFQIARSYRSTTALHGRVTCLLRVQMWTLFVPFLRSTVPSTFTT